MKTGHRILVLNERDPEHPRAGGAEIHVAEIFERLAARGHHVLWYASGFRQADRRVWRRGIEIERGGGLPAYYASVPARVRRARREGQLELVVECLNKIPFYAPLYADRPVLALCHHLFGSAAFRQVAWPIAAAVLLSELGLARAYRDSLFVTISESSRDDLVRRGIPGDHIRVSHPGIIAPTLRADADGSRPCRIAYVGRLEAYKGIDVLLRAAAMLVPRFPELEVVVIGRGREASRLEQLARELGLTERVRFTGFIEDAARDALLAETRACAFPSEKEGWGLSVIEANALATPVVASDAPGLRDSIRHEETGLLVAPRDVPGFAAALARLLVEDAETLRMRRAALEWSSRFDWERAADEMETAMGLALAQERR
ncbi:MAG: glycosyltransferase family 4 protein [Deltaproteobacteria bacterium]|jgi:glycosyltransferase involved in cell wall biosynthesis|nr:glycosyltransferase family 4 protein [Deltaproteobacteria bacterium]